VPVTVQPLACLQVLQSERAKPSATTEQCKRSTGSHLQADDCASGNPVALRAAAAQRRNNTPEGVAVLALGVGSHTLLP
jgi:hypothetical protein